MLNLTQHDATREQIELGVVEPDNKEYVKSLLTFQNCPTELDLIEVSEKLAIYAKSLGATEALIGGALYLMPYLIKALNELGIKAYYSFSKRVSVDKMKEDGTVEKHIAFKHVCFIEGTLPK